MEWIFILLLVLFIIMLIGHGMWVFLAWIFRGFTNTEPRPTTKVVPKNCPRCNAPLPAYSHKCAECGWPTSSSITSGLLEDNAATKRQLERFLEREVIDEATFQKLSADIESDRQRLLLGGYVTPPAALEPVLPSTVPPPLPVSPTPPRIMHRLPGGMIRLVLTTAVQPLR